MHIINLPVPPIRDNFPFPLPETTRLSSVEHLSNIIVEPVVYRMNKNELDSQNKHEILSPKGTERHNYMYYAIKMTSSNKSQAKKKRKEKQIFKNTFN